MNIAIYQVNMDRDNDNVAFLNYENLERFQGSNMINSKIYDKVFEGEVDCGSLEEVYRMFNIDHPGGYRGRSLSVSDVVEVASEEISTFYFCNSIGFKEIDFAPDMAETLKEKKINIVLCEPGKQARTATIEASLERYQKIVGGYIEAYYPFEEPVCIVCNEEGKINSLPLNRAVYADPNRGEMLDIIADSRTYSVMSMTDWGGIYSVAGSAYASGKMSISVSDFEKKIKGAVSAMDKALEKLAELET